MDNCKEPVSLRNGRLFNSVITRSGPMQRTTRMRMSQDALLDAFILLYDECNKDMLRKDTNVCSFINKYRTLVNEIKSLRVNLSDFDIKNTIGQGHFGEVKVVQERQTKDVYAMKVIKKFEMSGKICSVLFEEEHDIMCTATSKWLTTLQYSFQDHENLYFIMEYLSGGDLLSLLDRHEGIFTPEMAKFYLAETVLAIKALHQMGYVHRDIKPDNILLDCCGHVKLADFGSAAKLSSSGLVTQMMPVGTPEYIAPEILLSLDDGYEGKKKQCYGIECDYWSLGILAYELVVGRTPFSSSQIKSTYFNIMNHKKKFKYPDGKVIPKTLQDLISKLLEDPSIRLKHDGIVKHSFFQDINWNNIRNEVPPFVPSVSSPDDVSNFIDISQKKTTPRIEMKSFKKDFSGKQLPFIGFTYSHVPDLIEKKFIDSEDCNGDKKNALNTFPSVTKKDNKLLISKLFESQFGKNEEFENLEKKFEEKKRLLEICEIERNKLQREVAKLQASFNNIQRILEIERQDRKEMESNALQLISENKIKIERNFTNQISQLNARIEELNDKLTESHTLNNELSSKRDRIKAELHAANKEIEKLKNLEYEFKNKMAEAREFKRQSAVGLESRLEKIASENLTQINILQQKLNEETTAKIQFEEKLKTLENAWFAKETQMQQEIKDGEEKLKKFEETLNAKNSEIFSLQVQCTDKTKLTKLSEELETEKKECLSLKNKIKSLEQKLEKSTNSFLSHESTIAAHEETMQTLEKELREASEEKIKLQKKLQQTKEIEEENIQKLSNLEVVVDRLEQGVLKLEAENSKLKQQVTAQAQPITCEAEVRYQEKISILEDQIAKLENQLQKLRESSILDKESFRSTQSALWKAEKELSDAKIDVRIAKREAKTAEEQIIKLQEEIKKLNEKISETEQINLKNISIEREKLDKVTSEKARIQTEVDQKNLDIKMLKSQLLEYEDLKKTESQLKKNYNESIQKIKILEKQIESLKDENEKLKKFSHVLEKDKTEIKKTVDDLKQKISTLEINNTVLKETGAMLDEQLEDFDKFTTTQAQKIEKLTQEKKNLEKEVENIHNELRTCRQTLNEEKSFKLRAEQKNKILENEISSKDESLCKIQNDLISSNAEIEKLNIKVSEYEEKIITYESEITETKQMYNDLNGECQWLKKEISTYLTNLYSLRESNYRLTQDLEEEHQMVEALQERICELQNIITELEAFHKQREVKDESTKQQQNKLIAFLQEKLNDTKKKKTLTDVLFGGRNKENVVPVTSPAANKSPLNPFKSQHSSRNLLNSPTTKEALSQIVKSPTSQNYFQRHASLQRMHHNIPHRFKNQLLIRAGNCGGCHSQINRSTQCSYCTHCGILAHPKCAITVPKTCGLPQGLVKHYAKSIKTNSNENTPSKTENNETNENGTSAIEGWIKVLNSGQTAWEKKYARVNSNKIFIYEQKPSDGQVLATTVIDLIPKSGQVIVGDSMEADELPNTSKTNLPFIIKIAIIPETTCWPKQIHYLMILTSADKPKWLSVLNSLIINSKPIENQKYQGSLVRAFTKSNALDLNCIVQINEKVALLGTETGLFSLKLNVNNLEPVKIEGIANVYQIILAPQLGVALIIGDLERRLYVCDHRALISNAEAAACSNPNISLKPVDVEIEESCLIFSVSPPLDGNVFMIVATSKKLFLFKWCLKSSQFQKVKILETLHPCNCILYTKHSVILGCDKFFEIELRNYVIKEFLDVSIKSLAFWKLGSFPMQIFRISKDEFLLCFNEFGVFVNETGNKTQCDLKWSKVPSDFAYSKPYLFVFHMTSVEVIRVPFIDPKSSDDSICTSSTATVSDSVFISLNSPRYLGESKNMGVIYVKVNSAAGTDLILLDGKKLFKDELGSCASLSTVSDDITSRENKNDGDEFSFTSSLVQSLEGIDASTPKHSDDESCTTYTVSEKENPTTKKVVSFVPQSSP